MRPPVLSNLPKGQVRNAAPATDFEVECTIHEHDPQTGDRFAQICCNRQTPQIPTAAFHVFRRHIIADAGTSQALSARVPLWRTCVQAAYARRVIILSLLCGVLFLLCVVFIALYAPER